MDYSLGLYEKAIPSGKDFATMFAIARNCGFDRLEISIDESEMRLERLDWDSSRIRELGNLSRVMGTPLLTMCLSGHRKYPMGSIDPEIRKRSMQIMEKAIRFAAYSGISIIQLAGYDVYYEKGSEDTEKYFSDNLRLATDMAAENGIILAFETMETPFMDTVEKSMKYVRRIDSPYLGIYPDIGNLKNAAVLYGHDVVEDIKTGRGHIFATHLKETRPGLYRDMNFGDPSGHTEYERCIRQVLSMGVRIFTGEFWYQKGQDYMKIITKSSAFLRAKIEEAAKQLED